MSQNDASSATTTLNIKKRGRPRKDATSSSPSAIVSSGLQNTTSHVSGGLVDSSSQSVGVVSSESSVVGGNNHSNQKRPKKKVTFESTAKTHSISSSLKVPRLLDLQKQSDKTIEQCDDDDDRLGEKDNGNGESSVMMDIPLKKKSAGRKKNRNNDDDNNNASETSSVLVVNNNNESEDRINVSEKQKHLESVKDALYRRPAEYEENVIPVDDDNESQFTVVRKRRVDYNGHHSFQAVRPSYHKYIVSEESFTVRKCGSDVELLSQFVASPSSFSVNHDIWPQSTTNKCWHCVSSIHTVYRSARIFDSQRLLFHDVRGWFCSKACRNKFYKRQLKGHIDVVHSAMDYYIHNDSMSETAVLAPPFNFHENFGGPACDEDFKSLSQPNHDGNAVEKERSNQEMLGSESRSANIVREYDNSMLLSSHLIWKITGRKFAIDNSSSSPRRTLTSDSNSNNMDLDHNMLDSVLPECMMDDNTDNHKQNRNGHISYNPQIDSYLSTIAYLPKESDSTSSSSTSFTNSSLPVDHNLDPDGVLVQSVASGFSTSSDRYNLNNDSYYVGREDESRKHRIKIGGIAFGGIYASEQPL